MTIQLKVSSTPAEIEAAIEAAENGQEVVITRWGKPIAKFVPIDEQEAQQLLAEDASDK